MYWDTVAELVDRYTILMSEIKQCAPETCPTMLHLDVRRFIRQTERSLFPDAIEKALIASARTLLERGDPKGAMREVQRLITLHMH